MPEYMAWHKSLKQPFHTSPCRYALWYQLIWVWPLSDVTKRMSLHFPGMICPQFFICLLKDGLDNWLRAVLWKYPWISGRHRWTARSQWLTEWNMCINEATCIWFLNAACIMNRHIFPNHILGFHVPKKNFALAKIWEKQVKLEAIQESTNESSPISY